MDFINKFWIYIFLAIILTACGNNKTEVKTETTTDSNQNLLDTNSTKPLIVKIDWEMEAIDTVMSLKEIIDLGKEIEKNSKGKNHLTGMITETPDDNEKGYYGVKIGEDTGDRVVGMYNFNVYIPEMKIMYDDWIFRPNRPHFSALY